MIRLPRNITKNIYRVDKNEVWRCYGQDDVTIDNTERRSIVSRQPFIVEHDGKRILFSSKPDIAIPEECDYAILINHQINFAAFERNEFQIKGWLKHPAMSEDKTPDEVVKSWRGKFTYLPEDKEIGQPGLREPQLAAIHAFLSRHYTLRDRANIVMPTGTGKTETMLGILISAQCRKVLVTVPHDALRGQIFNKFVTLGCLHEFGIVAKDCDYPYVAVVRTGMDLNGWQQIVSRSNVIVSTMPLLAQTSDDVREYLASTVTNLFVDEAHHTEASTWSEFLDRFKRTSIIQFTATPFRNDGRKMRGEFIYTFSLRSAQEQGYYQKINFEPVYEIERKNADSVVARKAVEILRRDIAAGYDHILMARCKDKQRADQVFSHYEPYSDLNPIVIYSGKPGQQTLLEEIKRGEHKIVRRRV